MIFSQTLFRKKFNFLKFGLSRFMRFTPSLAVLFMIFMSSFPKKFVSGPQMSDVDDEQKECRESWVWSLLLLKNFHENLVRLSSVKGWNFFKNIF
jgi:hypothetical protein